MTSLSEILVGLPLLASVLLKITIVLGVSWSLHFILAKRNPRWRILLWRCAITGLLLIPALIPLAYLQISITPPPEHVVIAPSESALEYPIIETPGFSETEPVQISQPVASDISQASFSLTAWLRANIWMIVSVSWGLVATILILRLLVGFLRVRHKIIYSLRGPEHLQQLLGRVTEDLGCTKKVMLRYSPDMSTPFLTGLLNPIIIIPERMISGKYENRIPAIFAHEVAHLISRDLVWTFIIRWFEVVLWFHPLVWKLRGVHSTLCEEVSDAVAAKYIGNTESYSSTLASLALEIIGRVQVVGAIPMARSSEIVARLRTLKQRFYPARLARRWIILSGLVSFIALTVIGGINLVYAESDPGKSAARVLYFPKDRSLGKLMIQDADINRHIQTFYHQVSKNWYEAEYLGEAQGDVVISAGKRVGLFVNETAGQDLSALTRLKPDDLYYLQLPPSANNSCMRYVTNLTGLRDLDLQGNINDGGMSNIDKLKSLERLTLSLRIGDAELRQIAKLPSLKGLYFKETNVTDEGLAMLSGLPTLEELVLGGRYIGDAGLVHLAKLRSLSYLRLWGENFSDAGMACLKDLSSLKILNISHLPITDAGLRHLSGHTKLENLSLNNTQVTDRGLVYIKSIPSLKKLAIRNCGQITDAGMANLAEIDSLEYLDLPNHGITDKGLAKIANLTNLKYLWVCGSSQSPLTDTALRHVSKLQSLEYLLISGTGFTDAGMDDLAKLTNLREINLAAESITNEGVAKLKTLKSLEKVTLNCKNVTISGLSHLNALPNLVELEVRDGVQDNSGLDISGLSKLEELRLDLSYKENECVRDEDMACLKKLKNLKRLQIGRPKNSVITDAGTAYLANMPNMEYMSIGSPYLTDKSLSHFANMKKLNNLTITGNFTDDGLRYLEQLKGMNALRIFSAKNFSSEALRRLRDNLPNLYPNAFMIKQDIAIKTITKTKPGPSANKTVAPSFAVKTLDGKDMKLENYRGKVVLLYFWAMWCRPCVAGTPKLKKFYRDLKSSFGDDFEMISLSMDENERLVRRHVKKYKLTWPQVRIGLHSKISSDYGVNDSAPQSFLIGPDGKILLAPESPQVDTKSFIEELLKNRKL